MPSTNESITSLQSDVSNLNARLLAVTPNNLIFAALGSFVKYGCKVTEGSDDTDLILSLEGQAAGDSGNLNPDVSATPTRPFQYPNIASIKGGAFFTQDTTTTVATAPGAGTSRYDIAYIFAGKEGAGFAIATGTPSAGVKTDFASNGLQTGAFGEETPDFDPTLPVGAIPIARIYVAEDVTAITDAKIADLRSFSNFSTGILDPAFEVPPELGSITPNIVNASTLNAVDGVFTGDVSITDGLGVNGKTPPAQASHITDPTGGGTVDSEARSAIDAILVVIENVGFTAAA